MGGTNILHMAGQKFLHRKGGGSDKHFYRRADTEKVLILPLTCFVDIQNFRKEISLNFQDHCGIIVYSHYKITTVYSHAFTKYKSSFENKSE